MPMNSKVLTEYTGEKIVKIGQYLAKIWTKYDSLLIFGPPSRLVLSYACYSTSSLVNYGLAVARKSVHFCINVKKTAV